LNIDEATVPTESIVCTAIANNKIDNRCVSLTYEGEFVYINMDQNNLTQNFYYENDHTSGNTQDDGAFLSV